MAKLKNMIAIVLVLFVLLIAGCSTAKPGNNNSTPEPENTQDYNDFVPEENPDDNVPSITGNIIAVVNDERIKSEDVENAQRTLSAQGQQISEEDALEQVINQKVLEQKVQEEGITITTKEAESMIAQQLAMQNATLEDYKQQFESQGVSYEAELENIKNQIATQNYLENQLDTQSLNVTNEEALEFYEMYKAQSNEEVLPFEEVEPQIIATLQQQKQQEAINVLIQELRTNANVEYK